MSAPVEQQLREYFTMVDRMQGAVGVDSISQAAPPLRLVEPDTDQEDTMLTPNTTSQRTRPRTWLLAAAAVAVLALIGGLIVAGTRADEEEIPADDREPIPVTDAGLVPPFVMTSRFNQAGDVLEPPVVERGADVLGCSTLTYTDEGAGSTTDRTFTCESGERSGTFTVRFRPQGYANADFLGPWVVVGGTDDFDGLLGGGMFVVDIHDVDNEAGETFVGEIEFAADVAYADVDPVELIPEFVMSSQTEQSGDVLEASEVEVGAEALGCTALSYADAGAGATIDRTFTCESGERSGSFTLRFRPQGYTNVDFVSFWTVVESTGDFAGLQGDGVFVVDIHDTRQDAGETFIGEIGVSNPGDG